MTHFVVNECRSEQYLVGRPEYWKLNVVVVVVNIHKQEDFMKEYILIGLTFICETHKKIFSRMFKLLSVQ